MKKYKECRIFYETQRAIYCAYDNGSITRTWKGNKHEEECKVYLNKNNAFVKAGQKNIIVKHLMAELFIKGYKKGMPVLCADKNELNCSVDNLIICTKRQLGKETGHLSHKNHQLRVTFPNGKVKTYNSVRKASNELYCSYQTIIDYMNGKSINSILSGYKIKRIA